MCLADCNSLPPKDVMVFGTKGAQIGKTKVGKCSTAVARKRQLQLSATRLDFYEHRSSACIWVKGG
jgi:hypothetical protein